jgi:purine-binding chemotaxis protein CheW
MTTHQTEAYSRPSSADATRSQSSEGTRALLRCQIGRGRYLLPLASVVEIVRASDVTPVPQTPPWVAGLMNLRGRVLPVVDLAVKFGEPATVADQWTCFTVVEMKVDKETVPIALMVSLVHEVLEVGADDLEPPPRMGTRLRVEFIDGVMKTDSGLDLSLRLDKVLSADEIIAARDAGAAGV